TASLHHFAESLAYDARCTHQGAIVDPPESGVITCPLHGSQFKAEDGALLRGPAAQGLPSIPVRISGDEIVRA
ncbi:MAG: Rieske (2Fe-2S) protein, partial [Longispora sp.]|nr:Rieske (2Fe-2S) protein [Longispora sp. (in: high G+C Gram-positive bacteria)]